MINGIYLFVFVVGAREVGTMAPPPVNPQRSERVGKDAKGTVKTGLRSQQRCQGY